MNKEEKEIMNKMIYCNLINGEQAIRFNRHIEEMQQEIERLKKKLDCDLQWAKKYDELFEENNRLNNIIDELEKYLYNEYLEWKDSENQSLVDKSFEDKEIYDYLKELKEGK